MKLQYSKKPTHVCPCGYYNHPEKECVCAPGVVQKYLNKISGPLLDRIDLHVEVTPLPIKDLSQEKKGERRELIIERVINVRKRQEEDIESDTGKRNKAQNDDTDESSN